MHFISKEVEFDAGHRVPNHNSKCKNPHGHRYKVRATVRGDLVETPGASSQGMVVDFGDLKRAMTQCIHDVLDHGFIVYQGDEVMQKALEVPYEFGYEADQGWNVIIFPYIPTAENLALWCYERLQGSVQAMGIELDSVTVWETPTSTATYAEEF
jgi:6-pyruvoyltetrahydropterin/6-carboxytetrahydropterin synthase